MAISEERREILPKGDLHPWATHIPDFAIPVNGLLILGSAGAFAFANVSGATRWTHLGFGLLAIAVVTWPFVRIRSAHEVVSVWTLTVVTIAVGITGRALYIATGRPDQATIESLYLLGQPDAYFFWPSMLAIMALAIMTVGYFVGTPTLRQVPMPHWLRAYRVDHRRAIVVAIGLIGFGIVALLAFALETGGLNLLRPSAKRAVSPGIVIDEDFRGLGYLRTTAALVGIGYVVLLAYFATTMPKLRPRHVILLVGLFLSASLLPFYASSRSSIVWLVMMSAAILFYAGYRVRFRHIVASVLMILAIMYYMGALRPAQTFAEAELEGTPALAQLVDSTLLARHSIELTKTAHIINNVPEVLDWKNGSTIWTWLVAWVPREVWPTKPLVQSGPEVGRHIYGMSKAGVPPGFIAEMYWNFAVPGVILGSLLFGLLLRWLHAHFHPRSAQQMVPMLIYVVGVLRLGMGVLGHSLGHGIFSGALNVVLLVGLLWIIRDPGHTRRFLWRA